MFTGNKCVGDGTPLLNKDHSCIPCTDPGKTCPTISGNTYYGGVTSATQLCGSGNLEAGSTQQPLPQDGGVALAKETLGM